MDGDGGGRVGQKCAAAIGEHIFIYCRTVAENKNCVLQLIFGD